MCHDSSPIRVRTYNRPSRTSTSIVPSRSVRQVRMPRSRSASSTDGVRMAEEVAPAAGDDGQARPRRRREMPRTVELRLPWCATLSTSARRSRRRDTSSASFSMSPVRRNARPPASTRRTTEALFSGARRKRALRDVRGEADVAERAACRRRGRDGSARVRTRGAAPRSRRGSGAARSRSSPTSNCSSTAARPSQ